MSSRKSLKLNMILNALKGMLSIIFPLITFPYASRVLGVDNIGKYNYVSSIISYFVLIAGLGISTYAIREGSRFKSDKKKFDIFVSEVFTINIITTILSYLLFLVFIFSSKKINDYKQLLLLLSLQIAFTTIGIEWIYSIFEDYLYITLRSIVFQVISAILLFLIVRDKNDIYLYAVVGMFSVIGQSILNFICSKRYCNVRIILNRNLKRHLKPVFILFGMAATITIYVSSDTTILGLICGDYTVGIYAISVKVYNVVKTILSSILIVSIPRLSMYLGKNDIEKFRLVSEDIYKTLLTIVTPAVTGIILLRKEIVTLFAGTEFSQATSSLCLLSISLFFCLGAWFWGQCILIPNKKEKGVFYITVVSALINITLNVVLIPIWEENAAAITTIIAEASAFILCWFLGRNYTKIQGIVILMTKIVGGCIGVWLTSVVCSFYWKDNTMYTIMTTIISIPIYFGMEILLKNESMKSVVLLIKSKFLST